MNENISNIICQNNICDYKSHNDKINISNNNEDKNQKLKAKTKSKSIKIKKLSENRIKINENNIIEKEDKTGKSLYHQNFRSTKGKRKVKKRKKFFSNNDMKMDLLNYNDSIKKDKRTYCQYYLSLLRMKHILLFTFYQREDYNSRIIKIYLFFLIFFLNYAINAMFYSDNMMHKIYVDDGTFDITYQLPIMLYSSIITIILRVLLNYLGLYQKDILKIKKLIKKDKDFQRNINCIKYKIIFFYIFTYILLFFFYIYLGCFCAVYKNTQIHLLKEIASSFSLSFITPFFIYLLPGIFRFLSLKGKVRRPLLFKFSKFLEMF